MSTMKFDELKRLMAGYQNEVENCIKEFNKLNSKLVNLPAELQNAPPAKVNSFMQDLDAALYVIQIELRDLLEVCEKVTFSMY